MFVLQCIVEQITIQEHFELVAMGNTKAAYKWDEIRLVMQFVACLSVVPEAILRLRLG